MSRDLDKIRSSVIAEIQPLLPEAWDIKPGISKLDTLSKTTVFCEYTRIEPLEEAPQGNARCSFELTVVPPKTDIGKAENDVDGNVVDLVLSLDKHRWISWSLAEKKTLADIYIGWVVTVSAIASISKTPPPEE